MHVTNAKGAFTAQLLQQLETDMLLSLTVVQLTANIPDSYPGAQAARDLACQMCGFDPLYSFWCVGGLHQLPRPADYKGPLLALQLLPSLLRPQLPPEQLQPPQQQQSQPLPLQQPPMQPTSQQQLQQPPVQQQLQQQELYAPQPQALQQQQRPEWWMLTPSAHFLTELLPLLTRHCHSYLQQQQDRLQQFQKHCQQQPAAIPTCNILTGLLLGLRVLLYCSVVPAPVPTIAWRISAATAVPAGRGKQFQYTYGCVLPHDVQSVLMPHACHLISLYERAMRLAAVASQHAAAAAVAAVGGGAAATDNAIHTRNQATVLDTMGWLAAVLFRLCHPHHSGPLLLLALQAGSGSQVQRQLHSLLATMVKLSWWGAGDCRVRREAKQECSVTAAGAASALLADAATSQQQQLVEGAGVEISSSSAGVVGSSSSGGQQHGCSSSSSSCVSMLPSVVIMGRYCMQWGQQLSFAVQEQQVSGSRGQQGWRADPFMLHSLVSSLDIVYQWLSASSTRSQLTAAGYEPQAVLQQLDELSVGCQDLQDSAPDTAAVSVATQLNATGLAMCYSAAVACMCNNPCCTSMAGLSELATVSGRSCICGGCRVARYCSRACQRASWKQHKPVCAALSAATASTEAGAAATAEAGADAL